MPRPLLLGLALIGSCLLLSPALAQDDSPIKLEVRGPAGEKMHGVPRTFASVRVILENTSDKDVRGVLRAYRAAGPNRPTPAMSLFYEAEVDLPKRGRRVESLYYYVQDKEPSNHLCVAFEPEEGAAPTPAFPLFEVSWQEQVLLISRAGVAELVEKQLEDLLVPSRTHLLPTDARLADPAALPDHPAGYSPYGLVVFAEGELQKEQYGPLLEWVSGGGDLWVVSSGGRQPVPPELAATLPVHLSGQTTQRTIADLEAIQPLYPAMPRRQDLVLTDVAQLRSGAFLLAGTQDAPLIARGRYGAGWVTYFTFPLDAGPLKNWTGTRPLLRDLVRLPAEDRELAKREVPPAPPLEEVLLNLTEALENLEPPSTWIVAPLLILYVALVSPLNFFLLRKAKKLAFSQVSAGAVAVGFGVAFYTIGVAYKGSEALITQIGVVDLSAEPGRKSRVDVLSGYFSTGRGQTEAKGPKNALVGPLAALKLSNREARLRRVGDEIMLERVSLDTWALRRFRSTRYEDVGHLAVDLDLKEERVVGTIDNQTGYRLEAPTLIFAHTAIELSPIDPGTKQKVDRVPPAAARGREPIPQFVKALLSSSRNRYHGYYGMESAGIVNTGPSKINTPSRRLYASWQRRVDRVPTVPGHLPGLLVAYADVSPGGVDVTEGGRVALHRVLVVHEVQVEVTGKGTLSLQNVPPEIALHNSQGEATWLPTSGQTGTVPILQGSSKKDFPTTVYWRWRAPASTKGPMRVTSLKFRLQVDADTTELEAEDVRLDYFDFTTHRWESMGKIDKLPRRSGVTSWPEPRSADEVKARNAIHPTTGEVYVRLSNGSLTDLGVIDVRLDLGVEPAPRAQ